MSEPLPPKPEPKPRRPRGDGGFETRNGLVRGHKTIAGKKLYTSWERTQLVAAAKLKTLKLPDITSTRTVGEAIQGFLDENNHALSTVAGSETSIRNYLVEVLNIPAAEITRERVKKLYASLAERGFSYGTIDQAASILKKGLDFALDHDWPGVQGNAADRVKIPVAQKQRIKGFTDAQRLRFISNLPGDRYEVRWRLAIFYGLRPGEALGLTWRQLDLDRATITVSSQLQMCSMRFEDGPLGLVFRNATKSTSGYRTFSLDDETIRLLRDWRTQQERELMQHPLTEVQVTTRADQGARIQRAKSARAIKDFDLYEPVPTDLVFTQGNSDPLLPRLDATLWKRLLVTAKIPHARLYAARHTTVNYLLRSGMKLLAVSILVGHSSGSFTQSRYGGDLTTLTEEVTAFINREIGIPTKISNLPTPSHVRTLNSGDPEA